MHSEDSLPIENARIEDIPEIISLQRLAFRREAERAGDWGMPALTQTVEQLVAEFPSLKLFVIRENGVIIASGRAGFDAGTVHMGRLAVLPERQGRGLGTRLIKALEASFPNASRFEIFTSDVSPDNIRLYERMGYREFARRKAPTKAMLVYMEKFRKVG
jgi:ribosomal protein S18 acetylase RimI-like enzyme